MLRMIWIFIKCVVGLVLTVVACVAGFMLLAPVFGGSPDEQSAALIKQSPNHNGTQFINTVETVVSTPNEDEPMDVWGMLSPPEGKNPSKPLPAREFDASAFSDGDLVWFGHSTVLMKTDGVTVLADPVFYNASPIPFTVTPFPIQVTNSVEHLPDIDVVVISHDHYDHLDYRAIQELDAKIGRYLVPLGVKAHLQRWGIESNKVTEFDWYDSVEHQSLQITMAPSRHFSGRSIRRARTLWGSWIVKSSAMNIYFSGDSGYFEEFKDIGKQFGPFDMAFVENGAYNLNWTQIHMMPEQAVQAAIDLKAKAFFPIHWGKYDLSSHIWTEPVTRAKAAAVERGVKLATPLVGEVFTTIDYPTKEWWVGL